MSIRVENGLVGGSCFQIKKVEYFMSILGFSKAKSIIVINLIDSILVAMIV